MQKRYRKQCYEKSDCNKNRVFKIIFSILFVFLAYLTLD